jgi:hypothetical protein
MDEDVSEGSGDDSDGASAEKQATSFSTSKKGVTVEKDRSLDDGVDQKMNSLPRTVSSKLSSDESSGERFLTSFRTEDE